MHPQEKTHSFSSQTRLPTLPRAASRLLGSAPGRESPSLFQQPSALSESQTPSQSSSNSHCRPLPLLLFPFPTTASPRRGSPRILSLSLPSKNLGPREGTSEEQNRSIASKTRSRTPLSSSPTSKRPRSRSIRSLSSLSLAMKPCLLLLSRENNR